MKKNQSLKNVAASVREKLRQIREKSGEDFQILLGRYVNERLLYRLSKSEYKEKFILKGALMFTIWHGSAHRITRDVDLLGLGDASITALEKVFRELCGVVIEDDGVVFDASSVRGEEIRAQEAYVGVRIIMRATIDRAVVPLQIDVGFGDDFSVEPVDVELPSLLGLPSPVVRAYRRETAIAEKFEALVGFGLLNSRMKDYYDFWFLAQHFAFSGKELSDSIRATFNRRKTSLPFDPPPGLTENFSNDQNKQTAWRAFWKKSVKTEPIPELSNVVKLAASFLWPAALAAATGKRFNLHWNPGGPWTN